MDVKWLLLALCSLSWNLAFGSSDAEDNATLDSTDAKQWRNLKHSFTTTTSSSRKGGTTTRQSMSTTRKGATTRTTRRAGQLVAGPTFRTSTTVKRSGQQTSGGATGRTSTTMRRTTLSPLRGFNGPLRSATTSEPLRTMPPLSTPKGYTTAATTKPRGVPEKIKQGTTPRPGATTTAKYIIRTTIPVLPRIKPGVMLLASPFSFFGQPMYSPPILYGSFSDTNTEDTTNSTNLTTTVDPAGSTTIETATLTTTVIATVDNTTASNGTVEYEDVNEVVPTPPEYDYQEEGHSTTSAVSVSTVTEPTLNRTSTMGPNMIRKRRKKVTATTSATTPSTNPGVVRIKLRRKKTTIAPVTEAANENGA